MNKFDENIRKKLMDAEVEPPHHIWSSIENRLDNKKSSKIILWKYPAAAAAAILLIASSALLWLPSILNLNPDQLVHETSPAQDAASNDLIFENHEETAAENQPQAVAENRQQIIPADAGAKTTTPDSEVMSALARTHLVMLASRDASLPLHHRAMPSIAFAENAPETGNFEILAETTGIVLAFQQPAAPSFTLTAYFAPQQAYRVQTGYTQSMQALESQLLSFSTGLLVSHRIHKRWDIQAGAAYNRIGQHIHDIASFSHPSLIPLYSNSGMLINRHPQSMNTSLGGVVFTDQSLYFADISSSRITTLKGSYDETVINLLNRMGSTLIQQFEYLEIPVSARYRIITRPLEISARAGLSAHYLLSGNVYLQDKPMNQPIGHSVGVNQLNFGALGGIAFSYPVTTHMRISIEPTASMFIRPMGQIQNLNKGTYPYSWSVLLGISQDF
jgi:hypothetical protein